jgi:hypothetical protein
MRLSIATPRVGFAAVVDLDVPGCHRQCRTRGRWRRWGRRRRWRPRSTESRTSNSGWRRRCRRTPSASGRRREGHRDVDGSSQFCQPPVAGSRGGAPDAAGAIEADVHRRTARVTRYAGPRVGAGRADVDGVCSSATRPPQSTRYRSRPRRTLRYRRPCSGTRRRLLPAEPSWVRRPFTAVVEGFQPGPSPAGRTRRT